MNKETQAALSTMLRENLKRLHTGSREIYKHECPVEPAIIRFLVQSLITLYETTLVLVEDIEYEKEHEKEKA